MADKKNKGWAEAPDHTGKAPEHRAAANRKKTADTLRSPMEPPAQSCVYFSDNIRLDYIRSATETSDISISPSEFNEDNDFVVVKKNGSHAYYYEKWLPACWVGLYKKQQYKGLKRQEALDLFMKERFSTIALHSGYEVESYIYKKGILSVQMKAM